MKSLGTLIVSILLIADFMSSNVVFAHKGHGPHEHGTAHLQIAVEGKTATVLFEVPSESIYGFEYEPKTPADKAKQQKELGVLKNNFSQLLLLESKLKCKISNSKLDVVKEAEDHDDDGDKDEDHGEHREVHGEWAISCEKSLVGSKAKFAFSKTFSRLQKIRADSLSNATQKTVIISKDEGELAL